MNLRKAQSALEYAVVLIAVLLAIAIMGNYMYKSAAGKWRQAGDTIGAGETYTVP